MSFTVLSKKRIVERDRKKKGKAIKHGPSSKCKEETWRIIIKNE